MDEFEQYRAKAYGRGEGNTHKPLTLSNSVPLTQSPVKAHGHLNDLSKNGTVMERMANLNLSPCDSHAYCDNVFSPEEENVAHRMMSHHGGSKSGSPFMRSGTASPPQFQSHHNRSHSCRSRPARRPRELDLGNETPMRRRTYSMPTKNRFKRREQLVETPTKNSGPNSRHSSRGDDDEDYIRVRTFSTSGKSIINRGDSFKKRSYKNIGTASSSNLDQVTRSRTWSNTSAGSSVTSGESSTACSPHIHKVVVMGAQGVGKTSIIHQFMTSEYIGNSDSSNEEGDAQEPCSVSVLLDGIESSLQFIDQSPTEENQFSLPVGDAYIIVYSVIDHESFDEAVDLLHELRKKDLLQHTAVILVANKRDIVRLREIMEEDGKTMATRYDVKYTEVSAVLNHKIDELLAGLVKQIRLKEKKMSKLQRKRHLQETAGQSNISPGCLQLSAARGIVGRLFQRHPMFRSCDNLLVS